jgi:hypothetical protein
LQKAPFFDGRPGGVLTRLTRRSPDCSAAMMHATELSSSSVGPGVRAKGDGDERHSASSGSSGRWQLGGAAAMVDLP